MQCMHTFLLESSEVPKCRSAFACVWKGPTADPRKHWRTSSDVVFAWRCNSSWDIHYRLAQAVHSVDTPVIISSSADRASVFWKGQNSSDQWSFTSARNAEAPTMTSHIDLLRCITSVTRCGYKGESPRQASRYYHRFEWGPLLRLEVAFEPRIHHRWIHPVVGNRRLI